MRVGVLGAQLFLKLAHFSIQHLLMRSMNRRQRPAVMYTRGCARYPCVIARACSADRHGRELRQLAHRCIGRLRKDEHQHADLLAAPLQRVRWRSGRQWCVFHQGLLRLSRVDVDGHHDVADDEPFMLQRSRREGRA